MADRLNKNKLKFILLLTAIVLFSIYFINLINPLNLNSLSPASAIQEKKNKMSGSEEIVSNGAFNIKLTRDKDKNIKDTLFITNFNQLPQLSGQTPINPLSFLYSNYSLACTTPAILTPPLNPTYDQVTSFDRIGENGKYIVFFERNLGNNVILRGYDLGQDEVYGTLDDVGAVTLDPNIFLPGAGVPSESIRPVVNSNGLVVYSKFAQDQGNNCRYKIEQISCRFGPGSTCQNSKNVITSIPFSIINSTTFCGAPQFLDRDISDTKLAYIKSTKANVTSPQMYYVETYNLTNGDVDLVVQYPASVGFPIGMPLEITLDDITNAVFWRYNRLTWLYQTLIDSYALLPGVSQYVAVGLDQEIDSTYGPPYINNQFTGGTFYWDRVINEYFFIASYPDPSNSNYLDLVYLTVSPQGQINHGGFIAKPSPSDQHEAFQLSAYSPRINSQLLSFYKINNSQKSVEIYRYDYGNSSFQPYQIMPTSPIAVGITSDDYPGAFSYPNILMTSVNPSQHSEILVSVCR